MRRFALSGAVALVLPNRLVRYKQVQSSGFVQAANQSVVLRRTQWAEYLPHRHDADEDVQRHGAEAYRGAFRSLQRAFNAITWDIPELNIFSANFDKVTRKRADGSGREIQAGLRFVF